VQISPDVLFYIANFPVTNTVIATLFADIVVVMLVVMAGKTVSLKPGNVQNVAEVIIDYFTEITESIAGEKASFIYSWVVSFFIFIVISNLLAQIPGFESIKFYVPTTSGSGKHEVSFLRTATSDLNLTLALAVVSIFSTHYLSVKCNGIKSYVAKFITLKMFPILLFVGTLEFINELAKFISFSFRLFGNVFAGGVVVKTMYGLYPIVLPIPFMVIELMVSIIQAIVFAMLTMAFMHIMTTDKLH
jgi:F-type H+-transporting ATPase subunit a